MKHVVRGLGVLVMLAGVAACSSSSKSSASKTSPSTGLGSTSSSASPTGSPIKLGMICTCSGVFASTTAGPSDVFHAWVNSTNASGGIDGHTIDLKFMDDAGNPGTSLSVAQTLISDHVAAIVDLSTADSAWASPVSAAKIPVVAAQQSALFDTNPNFYSPFQTLKSLLYGETAVAKQAGATNVGLLYCAESPICANELPLLKTAGQQLGVPVVYNAPVAATAPNYTAQCVAAQEAKVQALNMSLTSQTATGVATDCNRQGYDPIYVANDATYTPTINSAALGKNFWLDFATLPFFADTPAVHAMTAAVDKYYPGLRSGHGGTWGGEAVRPWVTGVLIRDVVQGSGVGASGTVTAAAFTQGLYSLKSDDLDGWSSPLTFTQGQPNSINCWFSVKVVNGTPSVLNDAKPSCETNG